MAKESTYPVIAAFTGTPRIRVIDDADGTPATASIELGSFIVELSALLSPSFSKIQPRVTSVAYAATVTPNCDTTDLLVIGTLTGALGLATPSGTPSDGQQMRIRLVQDGTGRVVTPSSGYSIPTGDSIPSTASAKIVLGIEYNALTAKWMIEAIKTVS